MAPVLHFLKILSRPALPAKTNKTTHPSTFVTLLYPPLNIVQFTEIILTETTPERGKWFTSFILPAGIVGPVHVTDTECVLNEINVPNNFYQIYDAVNPRINRKTDEQITYRSLTHFTKTRRFIKFKKLFRLN